MPLPVPGDPTPKMLRGAWHRATSFGNASRAPLAALAGVTPGCGSGVDLARPKLGPAAFASVTRAAVTVEVMLVLTLASVDCSVVAQCRSAIVNRGRENLPQGSQQPGRLVLGDPPPGGVNPRQPEGFVGIDVPDTGNRSLAEKLGLDSSVARSQSLPEILGAETLLEGLRPKFVERGQADVVACVDDGYSTEPSDVAEDEPAVVVEQPSRTFVGVDRVGCVVESELAGHSEVDDQLAVVVEFDDQILAAPANTVDAGPARLRGRPELRRWVSSPLDDDTPHEFRLELASKRLDLREFWHRRTIPAARDAEGRRDESTNSATYR